MSYLVYGKPMCPNCSNATAFLEQRGEQYKYVDVSVDTDARTKMVEAGYRTVPQIFITNDSGEVLVYVGGYNELIKRFAKASQ